MNLVAIILFIAALVTAAGKRAKTTTQNNGGGSSLSLADDISRNMDSGRIDASGNGNFIIVEDGIADASFPGDSSSPDTNFPSSPVSEGQTGDWFDDACDYSRGFKRLSCLFDTSS